MKFSPKHRYRRCLDIFKFSEWPERVGRQSCRCCWIRFDLLQNSWHSSLKLNCLRCTRRSQSTSHRLKSRQRFYRQAKSMRCWFVKVGWEARDRVTSLEEKNQRLLECESISSTLSGPNNRTTQSDVSQWLGLSKMLSLFLSFEGKKLPSSSIGLGIKWGRWPSKALNSGLLSTTTLKSR